MDQSACRAPLLFSRDDGPAPDTSWRITEHQRAEVRRLHAAGLSTTKIAKQTGMAWSTARLIIEAATDSAEGRFIEVYPDTNGLILLRGVGRRMRQLLGGKLPARKLSHTAHRDAHSLSDHRAKAVELRGQHVHRSSST